MRSIQARSASEGPGARNQGPRTGSRAVILLTLALAGCAPAIIAENGAAPPAASQAQSAIEKVIAAKPARKSLQLFSTQPARLEAIESTPIHSKLAGYVSQVLVDIGDVVEKDKPLVKLSAPELAAEHQQKLALLDQAKAGEVQAQAAVRAAQAGLKTSEAKVSEAKAAIARTDADVTRWQSESARVEELAASGAVNKQLVDEAKQKLAAAQAARSEVQAAVASAEAAAAQAQAEVEKSQADVTAAAAQVKVAESAAEQANVMLQYLELKAPYAGVVTERKVDTGHFVQPAGSGAGPLFILNRTDIVRVFVAIPEIEVGQIDRIIDATIQVQALGGDAIEAQVKRASWALDQGSRSLVAVIDLPNADGRLRPGMYATARLLLAERADVLTLPAAAVVRKEKDAFCFRVDGGKVVQTPIQLGIKVGDDWEIAGGLSGDETIALNKAATLKDGQPVDAAPPEEKK
jgi:HlyD family secretion protein